ncbi:MAG: hypothetical protein PHG97_02095 [Candidatus Margulisbacteria bacterium]|nr:hypothetical protein [Candidatus Margulisiibacteriota bacterium]
MPELKKALILYSIDDARHCVSERLFEDHRLFSVHPGIDVYLRVEHGLECQCLSRFISQDEAIAFCEQAEAAVDRLLAYLDERVSAGLNRQTGFQLKYFDALYSYFGRYHLLAYICFYEALKKMIAEYGLKSITFYNFKFDCFFEINMDVAEFAAGFFKDHETRVIDSAGPANKAAKVSGGGQIHSLVKTIKSSLRAAKAALKKRPPIRRGAKNIFVDSPLYQLDFISGDLSRHNLIGLNEIEVSGSAGEAAVKIDFPDAGPVINGDKCLAALYQDIREDFSKNCPQFLKTLVKLDRRHKEHPIALGLWGLPPNSGLKALVFAYLRSVGIKVVGAQHGASYGDSYEPWHFKSDFNRCDYFISFGFTAADLARLYPDRQLSAEILPFGKERAGASAAARKKIDLLFPITISRSLFCTGMSKMTPDSLVARQIKLLEYLDSLTGFDIYVKPAPNPSYDSCSVLPLFRRFNNLKLVDDRSLTAFLESYEPKGILIECASTPLFDALECDAEIFLMNDFMHPFEGQALAELKQRVHYSEDTGEMISTIDLFLKNGLAPKRDGTFAGHYMNKQNREENIRRFIGGLVAN